MEKITKRPRLTMMNGIRYPEMFSPKCFKEAMEYIPTPDDVIISTYPKCGTTWMKNIVLYIKRKGKELDQPSDFMYMTPYIDLFGKECIEQNSRPVAIKTHLPYSKMHHSPNAKYIFVARNPKDCCVSFYYFMKASPGHGFWGATFSEFFELFMAGEVEYNDYFDHILDWYPHRNDPNVFYTTYEEMKKDIKRVILDLSKFLRKEYIDAIEKDNAVLNNIVLYSGMDYMKNLFTKLTETMKVNEHANRRFAGHQYKINFIKSLNPPEDIPKQEIIRSGTIDDWKNHFSSEQNERLNRKFMEKLKGTEILQWYPL